MAIDPSKLEKVVRKTDRRIQARCSACAANGKDQKGEHLVVFPNGSFGCVANPKNTKHNRDILRLAGDGFTGVRPLAINRIEVPECHTISGLGRQNPTPKDKIERIKLKPEPITNPIGYQQDPEEHQNIRPYRPNPIDAHPLQPPHIPENLRKSLHTLRPIHPSLTSNVPIDK